MKEKHKIFCEEYVKDSNGAQAAIRAGYKESRARQTARELLMRQDVKDYLAKLHQEIAERNRITVDECVQILAKMARFDISSLYDKNGNLKPIHDIDEDSRLSLESVESETHHSIGKKDEGIGRAVVKKVKVSNRKQSIDMIMKHLGGYKEDNSQKQPSVTMLSLNPIENEPPTDDSIT